MGLSGFSDKNISDSKDWDFAAGYVLGFREWMVSTVPDILPDDSYVHDFLDLTRVGKTQPALARLYGLAGQDWVPGKNTAKCGGNSPHTPPACMRSACGCGFWAYWERDLGLGVYNRHRVHAGHAFGLIRGYGRVIHGSKGFRAEYAEIEAIAVNLQQAEAVAEVYKIPPQKMFTDPRMLVGCYVPSKINEHRPDLAGFGRISLALRRVWRVIYG